MGLLLMVKLFGITFPLKITKKLDLIFYKSFKNIKELTIYQAITSSRFREVIPVLGLSSPVMYSSFLKGMKLAKLLMVTLRTRDNSQSLGLTKGRHFDQLTHTQAGTQRASL